MSHIFLSNWKISNAGFEAVVVSKDQILDKEIRVMFPSGFNASGIIAQSTHPMNASGTGLWFSPQNESDLFINIKHLSQDSKTSITFKGIDVYSEFPLDLIWFESYQNIGPDYIFFHNNIENQLKEAYTIFTVYAETPLGEIQVYSHYRRYFQENGRLNLEEEAIRMRALFTTRSSLALLSVLIGSSVLIIKRGRIPIINRSFPYLTFFVAFITMLIYTLWGTGYEVMVSSGLDLSSKMTVVLLSPFFHADYNHIFGNMLYFVPTSALFEMSLEDMPRRNFLAFYSFSYLVSIVSSAGRLFALNFPSFGISYVIIGLSVIFAFYLVVNRNKYKIRKWYQTIPYLAAGYFFGMAFYHYLAEWLLHPFLNEIVSWAYGHLYFFDTVFAAILLIWMFRPEWLKARN